ncbi:MAG: GEVED domain-containing protein [Bacteroidia bacterium]
MYHKLSNSLRDYKKNKYVLKMPIYTVLEFKMLDSVKLIILVSKSQYMNQLLRYAALAVFSLFIFNTSIAQTSYCTPKYSGIGHPTSRVATPFFTHFLRVSLSEIDKQTAAPNSIYTSNVYQDFTKTDTAKLTQTGKYPLNIELGNGANTQTFAIWIDYNHNNVFESIERVAARTDVANVGNHKHNFTLTIPANAVVGYTRMRIGTLYGTKIPDPCNNSRADNFPAQIADWSQHFQDYTIEIVKPNIQLFKDIEVTHTNFDELEIGSSANEILRIDVTTNFDGVISPLQVDTFFLSLFGSTDPSDIAKASLYYTGKNPNFHTNNLIDTLNNPGVDFTLNSDRDLKQGTNYFWLAVDIDNDALLNSRVDARCNGAHVITKRIPDNGNPVGDRPIGYCNSKGNRSMFVYVRRVLFNTINVYSTWNNSGYSNFTNRTTEIERGDSVTLTVEVGNGVNNSFTRAWIDFNADGDFNDANEMVLFDSITTASATTFTYGPVSQKFKVPANAKVGPTRMRVISASKTDVAPWKPAPNPCDEEVEIGEVEDYTVYIIEDGEPVADFSFNTVCSGDSTNFRDRSNTYNTTFYKIDSWNWDFGDGNTSTAQNPNHKYANSGTYKVRLIVNTNKPGTPDTVYKVVTVESPMVDFSYNTSLSKTPITFTDQTRDANVVYWEWNFGDPTSPLNIGFSPTAQMQYDTTGSYNVKLLIRTQGGCLDSIIKTVKIVSELSPIANYNASSFEPYKTAGVQMVDLSVNRPSKWTWKVRPASYSFVNSTNANSQNPVIAFNDLKTYTVTLVAENGAGLDSISRQFITKDYKKPEADFTANQTNVKAGQIVSFLNQSTNDPTVLDWKFGDGDSSSVENPIHEYDLTGKYTVSLNVANPAGKDSETKLDFIEVSDEYIMCESDVTQSPLFKGTLYDSGGKNGNYNASEDCQFLIVPDCSGPITIAFSEFGLSSNDYVRVFDYDIDDGILVPLHSGRGFTGFAKPANLKATLGAVLIEMETDRFTDTTGFKLVWAATPNVPPRAKILADTVGYINSTMILENKTVIGTNNSYYWDTDNDGVNDDSLSNIVSVTFDKQGYTQVRLVAENCKGTDTIYHTIKVDSATSVPTAKFYADDTVIYANDEIKFYDLSTQGPNKWKWEVKSDPFNYLFINGTTDSSRNPEIIFFEPGYYNVTLVATNDIGSSKKLIKNKYILVETKRTMCLWPFRDYSPAGRITDDGGDFPYSEEDCNFLLSPCAKEIILRFKEFDYRPGDFLFVYDGEDNTGTPLHPAGGFTFGSEPGTAPLIGKSGMLYFEHKATGLNSTAEGYVADWTTIPYDNPSIDFEMPDTAYSGGNVVFFYDKTDAKGNPFIKWNWDFTNNGSVDDTTQNPNYRFSKNRFYDVELMVQACDFKDSLVKTIRIIKPKGKPKASFTVNQTKGATTDIFKFTDKSTNGPGIWKWTFEPGFDSVFTGNDTILNANYTIISGSDTIPQLEVVFNKPDTYSVKLYVQNGLGNDSLVKRDYIVVYEYCTPQVTSGPTAQMGISFFEMADIKNSSDIGVSEYTDYSQTVSTKLTRGAKYPITIARNANNPTMNVKVWIDYNKDGDFDDTLENVLSLPSSTSLVYTDTVYINASVPYGKTKLRVGTSLGTGANTPCGPNTFGEFEDYSVIIGPDEERPVITINGDYATISEIGYAYVDSGATAFDNIDGDITSQIITLNNVDTSTVGTYYVSYNVKDAVGNQALEVTRTVFVIADQTKPVLTLRGNNPMEIEVYTSFNDPGADAFDNIDGDVTANISVENTIDTARLGEYDVIYSAFDNAGNFADAVVRKVSVVDTEAPIITLKGAANMILEVGDAYVEDSAEISDNYYTDVDLIISGGVNTNAVGTYEVYYDATDRSGNSATQLVRTVVVEDNIGINDITHLKKFDVYPNPASDFVYAELTAKTSLNGKVTLYDALGKQLVAKQVSFNGQTIVKFNVSSLSSGIYYLELNSKSGSSKQKFNIAR